jgi:hypothetical protein
MFVSKVKSPTRMERLKGASLGKALAFLTKIRLDYERSYITVFKRFIVLSITILSIR